MVMDTHIPQIDRVFASPIRFGILSQLIESGGQATFVALADNVLVNKNYGSLSTSIARLKREGYVAVRKRFVDSKPRTTIILAEKGRLAFVAQRSARQRWRPTSQPASSRTLRQRS
jgi:hypothetical protein